MKYKIIVIVLLFALMAGLSALANVETNIVKTGQVLDIQMIDNQHYLLTIQQRQCKQSRQLVIPAERIDEISINDWMQYKSYQAGCP